MPDARAPSAPAQVGGRGQDVASTPGRDGRLRVLLVEDDEQDAFLVGELLAEAGRRST